jgi:hypothetical protein
MVGLAPDLLRHYAKFALIDDHEIVFTHSDLAPRNILVANPTISPRRNSLNSCSVSNGPPSSDAIFPMIALPRSIHTWQAT